MFRIFWTNHGYWHQASFTSLDDAAGQARQHGFQATIYGGGYPVASYCPIGGLRRL